VSRKAVRAEISVTGSLPCEIEMKADYAANKVAVELTNVRRLGRVAYQLGPRAFSEAVGHLAHYLLGGDDGLSGRRPRGLKKWVQTTYSSRADRSAALTRSELRAIVASARNGGCARAERAAARRRVGVPSRLLRAIRGRIDIDRTSMQADVARHAEPSLHGALALAASVFLPVLNQFWGLFLLPPRSPQSLLLAAARAPLSSPGRIGARCYWLLRKLARWWLRLFVLNIMMLGQHLQYHPLRQGVHRVVAYGFPARYAAPAASSSDAAIHALSRSSPAPHRDESV
jgi:hypothetical protein